MTEEIRSDIPVLEVKNLVKKFDDEMSQGQGEILKGLHFSMQEGEFVCILGPSGCGKSTFLRCIGGFESYEGEILVRGQKVDKPGTDRIMVFQNFNQLLPWKSVEGNIQYPLRVQGMKDKSKRKEISDAYLEKVDLKGYAKYYPHQLSGGMKQRVAIARALSLKPEIILMDEPFASLDAMSRNNLQDELLQIHRKEKVSVIFITHNIQEAICLGTRILVMSKHGDIKIDMGNPIAKPVTPASEGYGAMWNLLHDALYD